jgi:hypothetical protein
MYTSPRARTYPHSPLPLAAQSILYCSAILHSHLSTTVSTNPSAAADSEATPHPDHTKADVILPPNLSRARKEFKRMAKMYLHNQAPPLPADMARLAQLRGSYNWPDIIRWQDEVGLRRGVVYDDEDDTVTFQDFWPLEPHEAIIGEFNFMFLNQLKPLGQAQNLIPSLKGSGQRVKPPKIIWYRKLTFQIIGIRGKKNPLTLPTGQILDQTQMVSMPL